MQKDGSLNASSEKSKLIEHTSSGKKHKSTERIWVFPKTQDLLTCMEANAKEDVLNEASPFTRQQVYEAFSAIKLKDLVSYASFKRASKQTFPEGLRLTERATSDTYSLYLSFISETATDCIVCSKDLKKWSLSEGNSKIISQVEREEKRLGANLRGLSLIVVEELKDYWVQVKNLWLSFWSNEFWIFYRLEVHDFRFYATYVESQLEPLTSKYRCFSLAKNPDMDQMWKASMSALVANTGRLFFNCAEIYKILVNSIALRLEDELKASICITPPISYFQALRLAEEIKSLEAQIMGKKSLEGSDQIPQENLKMIIPPEKAKILFEGTSFSFQKMFFKSIITHAQFKMKVDFDKVEEFKGITLNLDDEDDFDDLGTNQPSLIDPTEEDDFLLVPNSEREDGAEKDWAQIMNNQKDLTCEEKSVLEFIASTTTLSPPSKPTSEFSRFNAPFSEGQSSIKNLKHMSHSAKAPKPLEDTSKAQNNLISEAIKKKYRKIKYQNIKNTKTLLKVVNSLESIPAFKHVSSLEKYISSVHSSSLNFSALHSLTFSTASGAFGELLWDLIETPKIKIGKLSKALLTKTIQDTLLITLSTYLPLLGLSLAIALGSYGIYSFLSNQNQPGKQKVRSVFSMASRCVVKASLTVGGSVWGTSLFNIPALGGFIGGVSGGFVAAFGLSLLASFQAPPTMLFEALILYILWLCHDSQTAYSWPLSGSPPNNIVESLGRVLAGVSEADIRDLEQEVVEKQSLYKKMLEKVWEKANGTIEQSLDTEDLESPPESPQTSPLPSKFSKSQSLPPATCLPPELSAVSLAFLSYFHCLLGHLSTSDSSIGPHILISVSKTACLTNAFGEIEKLAKGKLVNGKKMTVNLLGDKLYDQLFRQIRELLRSGQLKGLFFASQK